MSNNNLRAIFLAGSILSIAVLVIAAISSVSAPVLASTAQQYVVTPSVGLNIRDKNCKKIGALKVNTVISVDPNQTIVCTINGVEYTMVKRTDVNTEQYVARNFIKPKGDTSTAHGNRFNSQGKATVNSTIGLNLRNDKCQIIRGIPYKQTVTKASDNTLTCTVKGVNYKMVNVNYNGKTGYVAEQFLIPA
jgi:hypothetical protein